MAALFLFDVDAGFLDSGGLHGAEVVGGLEAFVPGAAIHSVQVAACARTLHLGGGEEEVHGLGLVDPLLAAGGGVDDGFVSDGEDVGVPHAVFGDFLADDGLLYFAAAGDVDLAPARLKAFLCSQGGSPIQVLVQL